MIAMISGLRGPRLFKPIALFYCFCDEGAERTEGLAFRGGPVEPILVAL